MGRLLAAPEEVVGVEVDMALGGEPDGIKSLLIKEVGNISSLTQNEKSLEER